jgi:hypothetical protein
MTDSCQDPFVRYQAYEQFVLSLGDARLGPRENVALIYVYALPVEAIWGLTRLLDHMWRAGSEHRAPLEHFAGEPWLSSLRREAARSTWAERAAEKP